MNFNKEMHSLFHLKNLMSEQRLEQLIKEIYIPKLKVKFNAPYLYAGEIKYQKDSHKRRKKLEIIEENCVFEDKKRSDKDVIIGIESSFDESAASLVNSYGQVKAMACYTVSDYCQEYNGGIDPEDAKAHHIKYVPKAIDEVLDKVGDNLVKGIAFTIGPGQIQGL